jgi:hypothetical protein
LVSLN